jgi:hypothetical protein
VSSQAAMQDDAMHVMPDPPGPSLTELMVNGPTVGPRHVNLDAYRDKFSAEEWLALQAFTEEVEIHAGKDEMQRLVDLTMKLADAIAPKKLQPFLNHMWRLVQHRRADLILVDFDAIDQAYPTGIIPAAHMQQAMSVDPMWRIQELGNIARGLLQEGQPTLFNQPQAQTNEAGTAMPAPEQTNCQHPSTEPASVPDPTPVQDQPKGENPPMPSIVASQEALDNAKASAKRIRDAYELPQIKEGLKAFIPQGANPGAIQEAINEQVRINKEIKAIRKAMRTREIDLQATANLPPTNEDGTPLLDDKNKPVKLTVDQRKLRLEQLLLTDPEYIGLKAQEVDLEAELEAAKGQKEAAEVTFKALRALADIVSAELLTIGGF